MNATATTSANPPPAMQDRRDRPAISIVAIGRNEGDRLTRCLESIRAADYPADRVEILYVDSRSSDDSCVRAERFGARVIRIPDGPLSAARGRNLGWRAATHDLVHFLDADTLVNPHWLNHAVDALRADPGIVCVFGRREEINPTASLYMRAIAFDWHVPAGVARYCGGDALFRKAALQAVGGFNEDFVAGEEPELCFRLRNAGLRIWRLDQPMTLHDLNIRRFKQYWRRAVRSGWAYAAVGYLCREGPNRLWRRENLANLLDIALWIGLVALAVILRSPWPAVALLALLLCRTLWIGHKVRRRAPDPLTALLYGLHCQTMRLPVFIGQIRGLRYALSRKRIDLIEYK